MRWRLPLPVLVVVTAVTLATSSCLSPTLPLPPPEQPDSIRAGTEPGTWVVSGTCTAGATVLVINEVTGQGVITEDRTQSGNYSVILAGKQCDEASVRESFPDGQEAGPTTFTLAKQQPGDPIDNPLCH
jgi:hypothetical protein